MLFFDAGQQAEDAKAKSLPVLRYPTISCFPIQHNRQYSTCIYGRAATETNTTIRTHRGISVISCLLIKNQDNL